MSRATLLRRLEKPGRPDPFDVAHGTMPRPSGRVCGEAYVVGHGAGRKRSRKPVAAFPIEAAECPSGGLS